MRKISNRAFIFRLLHRQLSSRASPTETSPFPLSFSQCYTINEPFTLVIDHLLEPELILCCVQAPSATQAASLCKPNCTLAFHQLSKPCGCKPSSARLHPLRAATFSRATRELYPISSQPFSLSHPSCFLFNRAVEPFLLSFQLFWNIFGKFLLGFG